MGSTMKPTIFNERVAAALRNWHQTARKHLKQSKGSVTPMSSRPTTPSHHMSPVHLLRHYRSEMDSVHTSPRRSNFDVEHWETDSPSPSHHYRVGDGSSSHHHGQLDRSNVEYDRDVNEPSSGQVAPISQTPLTGQHEIDIGQPKDFSFDMRTTKWFVYRNSPAFSSLETMTTARASAKNDVPDGIERGDLIALSCICCDPPNNLGDRNTRGWYVHIVLLHTLWIIRYCR